ncbi:MAG: hypothetical protein AB2693_15935 [Candidatus Thiodiazotropha sp.]
MIRITQNDTWLHHFDVETKAQSKQWKKFDSPPPKKALSAGKVKMIVFINQCRGVMMDFLAKGALINVTYYCFTSE